MGATSAVALFIFAGHATALVVNPVVGTRTMSSGLGANATLDWSSWAPRSLSLRGKQADYGHPAWLSECASLYVDIGSNIGVQIRKLFEPYKYPEAFVLQPFQESFGPLEQRAASVCALGMEPNPHHQPRLQALEKAYNKRGFRTHFYPFAAWKEEGELTFHTAPAGDAINGPATHHEWGAQLPTRREDVRVRTVDLTAFLLSLPRGKIQLMKLDIEGAEWEVLAKAIPAGIFCQDTVSRIIAEAHPYGVSETWNGEQTQQAMLDRIRMHECPGSAPCHVLGDDETYWDDVDDDFDEVPTH